MSSENFPEFSKNLRRLRLSKNYSQFKLADMLNVSVNLIAMYEHQNRTPSLKILVAIAEIFDVSIDELLGISTSNKSNLSESILGITMQEYEELSSIQKQEIRDFIDYIKYKNK